MDKKPATLSELFNLPKAQRQKIMEKVVKQSIESQEQVIREADLKEQARERAVNQAVPAINTQDLETVKGPETQEVAEGGTDN